MSDNTVTIERFRPSHLHNKPHFTSMVTSEGGKTIHVSGLVASDSKGELVAPGDLSGQMNYIFGNIKRALAEVGATYDRAEASDYDIGIFRNTWWMGVPYLTFLTHSSNIHSSNFGQIKNEVLDRMLELAGEELDDDLRREAFIVAQSLVVESAVWIPLVANSRNTLGAVTIVHPN